MEEKLTTILLTNIEVSKSICLSYVKFLMHYYK